MFRDRARAIAHKLRLRAIINKLRHRSHAVAIAMELHQAYRMDGKGMRSLVPKTFHQKLLYKKLRDRRDYLTRTADKFAVREHVASIVGDAVLTELYAVTDEPDRLPFDTFPTSFAVKATHGSNWCLLVPDDRDVKPEEIRTVAADWLRRDFGWVAYEPWYSRIPPRVMVEEYLGDSTGKPPPDYKFYVMHGHVEMIQLDFDRYSTEVPERATPRRVFAALKRNLYTPEWEQIDVEYMYPHYHGEVQTPPNLDRMLRIASALGAGTDFVRVDLYDLGDRVVFGELTHCPGGAYSRFSDPEFDLWLGSRWRLPLRYSRRAFG